MAAGGIPALKALADEEVEIADQGGRFTGPFCKALNENDTACAWPGNSTKANPWHTMYNAANTAAMPSPPGCDVDPRYRLCRAPGAAARATSQRLHALAAALSCASAFSQQPCTPLRHGAGEPALE